MVVPRQPLRLMASPFPATSDHAGATSRVTNGLTPDGTTSVQTGSPSEERDSYAVAAVAKFVVRPPAHLRRAPCLSGAFSE